MPAYIFDGIELYKLGSSVLVLRVCVCIIRYLYKETIFFFVRIIAKKSSEMEEGKALQIIKINKNGFKLDEELLDSVLNRPEIKDRKVVVISITGAFRKGKSFLLGFFLRYLYAEVCEQ